MISSTLNSASDQVWTAALAPAGGELRQAFSNANVIGNASQTIDASMIKNGKRDGIGNMTAF
jgi:hypothetical protein